MSKLAFVLIVLLTCPVMTFVHEVRSIGLSAPIFIKADGSIDPPTAPISTLDNITYALTGNITDSIYVERTNITIDGSGFVLLGSYGLTSINVADVTNVTIRNMDISGFSIGINFDRADYNAVSNSNVSNCFYGIQFSNSSNTFLMNNSIKDCMCGIWVQHSPNNKIIGNKIVKTFSMGWGGIEFSYSPNNTVSGNTLTNTSIFVEGKTLDDFMQSIDSSNIIDGKNAYYITSQNGLQVSPLTHPLVCILGLINSTRVTIEGFASSNVQIQIAYTNDSSITNCTSMGGVQLIASSHNDITNNTLTSSISLSASSNNQITSVTAYSISLSDNSCYNTIEDSNVTNIDIDNSSSQNFVAQNNIRGGWGIGIDVDSEYNNIFGNKITLEKEWSTIGVSLAPNNTATENSIVDCQVGIATEDFTSIVRNSITECIIGVVSIEKREDGGYTFPAQCNGVVLFGNNITHCLSGVRLDGLLNCTIVGNNIESNNDGIDALGARYFGNNVIYHNNFLNNTNQVFIEIPELQLSPNIWDNDYPSGGNFWSNYTGVDLESGFYQNETSSDGIGDIPHTIDANNKDNYPLMGTFSDFNATSELHVQTICNSTIFDLLFNDTAIIFDVSGENGTTGFCRICIPTALMNGICSVC